MRRIFAKTISLMLVLGIFMSIPALAEEAEPTPTPKPLKIEQYQFERNADGKFISVDAGKVRDLHLLPVVGDTVAKNENALTIVTGDNQIITIPAGMFNDALSGVVDNVITVRNESPSDGGADFYFRTLFAVESPEGGRDVVLNFNTDGSYKIDKYKDGVTINETVFDIYVAEYQGILEVGDVAPPSLLQVYLPSETTSEEAALYGESFELMVVSQAIQKDGVTQITDAMNHLGEPEDAFTGNRTLLEKLKELIQSIFSSNS